MGLVVVQDIKAQCLVATGPCLCGDVPHASKKFKVVQGRLEQGRAGVLS